MNKRRGTIVKKIIKLTALKNTRNIKKNNQILKIHKFISEKKVAQCRKNRKSFLQLLRKLASAPQDLKKESEVTLRTPETVFLNLSKNE